jgi:hypothetical protein
MQLPGSLAQADVDLDINFGNRAGPDGVEVLQFSNARAFDRQITETRQRQQLAAPGRARPGSDQVPFSQVD